MRMETWDAACRNWCTGSAKTSTECLNFLAHYKSASINMYKLTYAYTDANASSHSRLQPPLTLEPAFPSSVHRSRAWSSTPCNGHHTVDLAMVTTLLTPITQSPPRLWLLRCDSSCPLCLYIADRVSHSCYIILSQSDIPGMCFLKVYESQNMSLKILMTILALEVCVL